MDPALSHVEHTQSSGSRSHDNESMADSSTAPTGGEGNTTSSSTTKKKSSGGGGINSRTKADLQKIPLLSVRAGPRDPEWPKRLKSEYQALIKYIQNNKASGNDWFTIKSNKTGTKWEGTCWYYYETVKYEFKLQFEMPVTYPATAPEIQIPELEGKTAKMYRGGKICLTIHFNPLWSRNSPRFGIAHALALGLGPWLAAEIPDLVRRGVLKKDK